MGFFDDEKNVQQYMDMADGYDGKELIEILKTHLRPGSHVLELGMGPGKDLDLLKEDYSATGSDFSKVFLDLYREKHKQADLLLLDAVKMDTNRVFDCIYSNKVLHHLTKEDLEISLEKQRGRLAESGLLFHSFWKGDETEEHEGMLFTYYREAQLKVLFEKWYKIIEIKSYSEMDDDDSIYVIAGKS